MTVECTVYTARLPEKTCALRYRNANGGRMLSGPGCDDYNCRVCETGRRLYEEGWHKSPEMSFQGVTDKGHGAAAGKAKKEGEAMKNQDESGGAAVAARTDTAAENGRSKHLLTDPAGNAYGRICTKCGRKLEWVHFNRSKKGLCGYQSQCRDCVAAYHKNHTGGGCRTAKCGPAARPGRAAAGHAGKRRDPLGHRGRGLPGRNRRCGRRL